MKDDDFKLLRGFADERTDGRTNERTDICDCRVAFETENVFISFDDSKLNLKPCSNARLPEANIILCVIKRIYMNG